jgi:LuxR family maltose regulon positive regulatory protein
MEVIDQALAIAEPEGRIRSFIDCGEPIKNLLSYRLGMFEQHSLSAQQKPLYAYVLRLLEHYKTRAQKIVPVEKPAPADQMILSQLIEPLSERELEVLDLLAKGQSSGEVAHSLVISVNTAKAHIKSIYQKLDVHSRKEAVEMAVSLRLLVGDE